MFPPPLYLGFPHKLIESICISRVFLPLQKFDLDHFVHMRVSLMLYLSFDVQLRFLMSLPSQWPK